MPVTDSKLKAAKPKGKAYRLFDSAGLYLEVMPSGSKIWRFKYRFNNKENRLSFGAYPHETSLLEAREKRDKARKILAEGIDPSFAKKEADRAKAVNAGTTFEAVARKWHETHKDKWSPLYARELLHRLEKDVFPAMGWRPIADIKARELLDVLRKIENRGAREIAHRARNACSQIFRFAIVEGWAERDVAADLLGSLKPVKHTHYAALEAKDIPDFVRTLNRNDARLYPSTRRAVAILMHTFVRTAELIGARWDEIDLEAGEWLIPAERMKMDRPHIVPLSRQVIALLKEQYELTQHWDFVFPNVAHPQKTMSNATILGAIKRMGYKGQMTGHGFRALAMSTIKEKLGYRHEVVDRQLAHAPRSKIDRAYDRAQFLDERRKMMQEWSDYLDVAAASGGKVVVGNFKRGAA